jgi:hypothetical protein
VRADADSGEPASDMRSAIGGDQRWGYAFPAGFGHRPYTAAGVASRQSKRPAAPPRLPAVPPSSWPHHHGAENFIADVEVIVREAAALVGKDAVMRVLGGVLRKVGPCSMLLKMK